MGKKRSVRAGVAGLVFSCALAGMPSMTAQADTVATPINVGLNPNSVAINPAGTFAYVTNQNSSNVSKIDLATDAVVKTITVGTTPMGVAINPAGTFGYVVNYGSNTVSKINLATDAVTTPISVGSGPQGLAINPAGTFAYVSNRFSGTVSKIDLATNVASPITVGSSPLRVAIDPAGTFAYVTNSGSSTVSKINLATDAVTTTITVGTNPDGVAIDPAGTFAYVTNSGSNTVSKINLATDTVVATFKAETSPTSVAINPAGTFAYVTHYFSGIVSKINLATFTWSGAITIESGSVGAAFNPAGTFAYVTNISTNTVSKITPTTTGPQSIRFPKVSTQLLGAKTVELPASASSTLAVAYDSATPTVCAVTGSTVTMLKIGDCIINANQAGGSGWDAAPQVSQTFAILPTPPPGEPGVSIKNGDAFTNTKNIALNLVWPEYATGARISNDGGFATSKTTTVVLGASINWNLDDSVKGLYTKVVYVRFDGVADISKTYTDDIILDTTAPTIDSSTASAKSGTVEIALRATDDITGVSKVQIKNGSKKVTEDYRSKISVTEKELGLSVSTAGVRKADTSSMEIRVSDRAGNWSAYQKLSVYRAGAVSVKAPKITTTKSATAKSIAVYAKLAVALTSKVSLKIVSSSVKYCKVSGTSLRGLKAGSCKITVTVTPKQGRATFKTVTLKVTK